MGIFGKNSRELSLESELEGYKAECLKKKNELETLYSKRMTAQDEADKLNILVELQNHKLAIYALHATYTDLKNESEILLNCGFFMNGAIECCSFGFSKEDELTEQEKHEVYYFCEKMTKPIEEFSENLARLAPKIRSMKQKIEAFELCPYSLHYYYDELYNLSEGLRTASRFNDFVEGIKTFFLFSWSAIQWYEESYAAIGVAYARENYNSYSLKLNYSDDLIKRYADL